MTPSWFSPETVLGLIGALLFGVLCHKDMRRAIVVLTAAGAIHGVRVGAFAGEQVVQGLLPIEVLTSVALAVWVFKSWVKRRMPLKRVSFNVPLLLLIPASFLSLVVGFTWFDHTVPLDHMKLSVAFGQITIVVWAVGLFLVVANAVDDRGTVRRVWQLILVLATPAVLLPFVSIGARPFLEWSMTFALPASSLAAAELFDARAFWHRVGLVLLVLAPLVFGLLTGKAFFYGYVVVSTAVIVALHLRYAALPFAAIAFAVYLLMASTVSSSLMPSFATGLIKEEKSQQSLGGPTGRGQLMLDGLSIWSRFPVAGVGPGNNYPYMLRYSRLGTSHNQYVNLLMELGLIGFACFATFAMKALHAGWRLWRVARDPFDRRLALAWLGLFAGMLVGGFFGDFMIPSIRNDGLNLFGLYYVQWIVLGLVGSVIILERRMTGGII